MTDKTLKGLSILLQYPTAEMVAAVDEIMNVLAAEGELSAAALEGLQGLRDYLAVADIYRLQEEYVALFDRTRALSLHLFEHVHGESRDRGQAMVNLIEHYQENGMQLRSNELPDYLPLFLEFCSTLAPAEARKMLEDPVTIVAVLGRRLLERGSPYAAIFGALEEMAGVRPDADYVAQAIVNVELQPESGAALDKAWQDTEVIFGPGQQEACDTGCSPAPAPRASSAHATAART